MAGIGFELNKMARRDDLMGIAGAYLHSAFAIAGPWLFTVVALAFTTYMYGGSNNEELLNFRGTIVYNFSFSLALSAPVYFIITRYLADQIHVKNVTSTPIHAGRSHFLGIPLPPYHQLRDYPFLEKILGVGRGRLLL